MHGQQNVKIFLLFCTINNNLQFHY